MHQANLPRKNQILFVLTIGAWLAFAWGMRNAIQHIAAQQWLEFGLWRLAFSHTQLALQQAWQEIFFILVPIALPQIALPKRTKPHPIFLAACCLWGAFWALNGLKNHLRLDERIAKPLEFDLIGSGLLIMAAAAAVTFTLHRIGSDLSSTAAAQQIFFRRSVSRITLLGVVLLCLPFALKIGLVVDQKINIPTGPNVVLIVVDTLRADHMGVYGYAKPTTPNLDRFAKDAIVFQNAISTASWTTPSIATMLSSRYPRGRVWPPLPLPLPQAQLMLAELFRNENYQTLAFVSHYYIGGKIGFSQGFDLYDDSQAKGHRHVSSPTISQQTLEFLDQNHSRPFFLFLHYFDVHYDYFSHEPHLFAEGYTGKYKSGEFYQTLKKEAPRMSTDDLEFVQSLYDSEIRFVDENISLVLEHLKKRNLYENTLIVFVADHGEEFAERGDSYIGHTNHVYQQLVHVPLFVKLPGKPVTASIEQAVSLIDLAPTIAHHAKLPKWKSAPFQGRPILLDEQQVTQSSPIFSEAKDRLAWVSWPWKLLLDTQKGTRELYNLASDPQELRNIVTLEPGLTHRLEQELVRFIEDHPVATDALAPVHDLFSPEEIEQLKAMGYVE